MYGGIGFPPKAELARPTGKAFLNRFPPANLRRDLGNRLRSKCKGKMRQQISFARVDKVDTQSFPAACTPETCFFHQRERWWKKQFPRSARRPEIPKNFGARSFLLTRQKNRQGFLTPS
jgi:hypothetical protein